MTTKKNNVENEKENMKAKKNNAENKKAAKEFAELIRQVKRVYSETTAQEEKQGKNLYNLGELLCKLQAQNKKLKRYSSFEELCKKEFAFSRQYGYRMIAFYNIQKELHEKNLLDEKKFLPNAMMLALKRAQDPSVVWQKACEMTSEPTEALVSQIIDEMNVQTQADDQDISNEISQATTKNIINILQKINKQKYDPTDDEKNQLIKLLQESWKLNGSAEDGDAENEEDEVA